MNQLIKIEIEAEFGSDFQKETANKTLELMILGWVQHIKYAHKKNRIDYAIEKTNK